MNGKCKSKSLVKEPFLNEILNRGSNNESNFGNLPSDLNFGRFKNNSNFDQQPNLSSFSGRKTIQVYSTLSINGTEKNQ